MIIIMEVLNNGRLNLICEPKCSSTYYDLRVTKLSLLASLLVHTHLCCSIRTNYVSINHRQIRENTLPHLVAHFIVFTFQEDLIGISITESAAGGDYLTEH